MKKYKKYWNLEPRNSIKYWVEVIIMAIIGVVTCYAWLVIIFSLDKPKVM